MSYISGRNLATTVYLVNSLVDALDHAGTGSRHLNDLRLALDSFTATVELPEATEVRDPLNPQVRFAPQFATPAADRQVYLPYELVARLRQSAADFEVTLKRANASHLAPDLPRLRYLLAEGVA